MAHQKALLMVKTNPPTQHEQEWNEWYNKTHVGARIKIEAFLSARRFQKLDSFPDSTPPEAKYLALYDIADLNILRSKEYQQLRDEEAARGPDSFDANISKLPGLVRGLYKPIFPETEYVVPGTKYLFVVAHDVPRNRHQEFNAWYNTEHLPLLMKVPGVASARRFKLLESGMPGDPTKHSPPTYLSVYDIENKHVLETEEFSKATSTPWTQWVRSWYTRRMRMVYRLIYSGR